MLINIASEKIKSHQCEIEGCTSAFSRMSALIRHEKQVHNLEPRRQRTTSLDQYSARILRSWPRVTEDDSNDNSIQPEIPSIPPVAEAVVDMPHENVPLFNDNDLLDLASPHNTLVQTSMGVGVPDTPWGIPPSTNQYLFASPSIHNFPTFNLTEFIDPSLMHDIGLYASIPWVSNTYAD